MIVEKSIYACSNKIKILQSWSTKWNWPVFKLNYYASQIFLERKQKEQNIYWSTVIDFTCQYNSNTLVYPKSILYI